MKKIIIDKRKNASEIIVYEGKKLIDYFYHSNKKSCIIGNIYVAKITKYLGSIHAYFLRYGAKKDGFLEANHTTFQIGEHVIVQAIKNERQNKAAVFSTKIKLKGAFVNFFPRSLSISRISRKIDSTANKSIGAKLLVQLTIPRDSTVIIRRNGVLQAAYLVQNEINSLFNIWKKIATSKKIGITYKEKPTEIKVLHANIHNTDEVIVNQSTLYNEVIQLMHNINCTRCVVTHYTKELPILMYYKVHNLVKSLYQSRIILPAGGSIVLEQTEAMYCIDVNSGNAQYISPEIMAFKVNTEAIEKIMEHIKLRHYSGLIAIDLIDMKLDYHKLQILNLIRDYIAHSNVKCEVSDINKFGVVFLSRARVYDPLLSHTSHKNNHHAVIECLEHHMLCEVKLECLLDATKIHITYSYHVKLSPSFMKHMQKMREQYNAYITFSQDTLDEYVVTSNALNSSHSLQYYDDLSLIMNTNMIQHSVGSYQYSPLTTHIKSNRNSLVE